MLNEQQLAVYRSLRAKGRGAKSSWREAKANPTPAQHIVAIVEEGRWFIGNHTRWVETDKPHAVTYEGFDVTVELCEDDSGIDSFDYLGAFKWSRDMVWTKDVPATSWDIERATAPFDSYYDHGRWQTEGARLYYVPMNSPEETKRYFREKEHYTRHDAWLEAQRQWREDMKRLLEFYCNEIAPMGVTAKASLKGVTLGVDSLWGLASDDGDYLNEVADEVIAGAVAEAKKTLDDLVATHTVKESS